METLPCIKCAQDDAYSPKAPQLSEPWDLQYQTSGFAKLIRIDRLGNHAVASSQDPAEC
jgi:hypothetical protein